MTGLSPGDPAQEDAVRGSVRARYAQIVTSHGSCCAPSCCDVEASPAGSCAESGCCTETLGYSAEELASLPPGANLGLGCGNPAELAELRSGEVVLDLGSGAGIDCFLAAQKVGLSGRAIGVDMTPEMVARARELAQRSGVPNVEFRLGEIEHLPVADGSVDVVVSNCVINLAPDKAAVYREAFRALRPGGRLAVSDMVALSPIPEKLRADLQRWSSCSSGALSVEETLAALRSAGFVDAEVRPTPVSGKDGSFAGQESLGVVSARVRARRPR